MRLRASFVSNLSFLLVSLCAVLQAQSKPPRYVVKDLGALSGSSFSQPGTLSNDGIIAGFSIAPDGYQHPVVWIEDHIIDLDWSGGWRVECDCILHQIPLGVSRSRRRARPMTLTAQLLRVWHTSRVHCGCLAMGQIH